MNKDIFRYKCLLTNWILVFSYAFMHVKLTGIYLGATLEDMTHFTAPLPFGQRLMIPALVHVLLPFSPFNISELFFYF